MIGDRLGKHSDVGLLIIRLGFGLGFLFLHGWGKLVGGPEVWADIGSSGMETIGITFGHTAFGFLAALAESLGGLFLALGLFTRWTSLVLAAVMVMAYLSVAQFSADIFGHPVKNIFLFAGLMFVGPGRIASTIAWASSSIGADS